MSDPYFLLVAINENPNDPPRWLALAAWYADHRRNDEADAVRVLWPVLRDCLETTPLDELLRQLREGAKVFAGIARHIEGRCNDADGRAD